MIDFFIPCISSFLPCMTDFPLQSTLIEIFLPVLHSFGLKSRPLFGYAKPRLYCMIAGKNIHKKYGDVEVLKGVDMEIRKGEIVSIVGPSGSGKSTLLHILGTLDHPDTGYAEVSGVKIEYQPTIILQPAAWWKRLINGIVDITLIGLFASLPFSIVFPSHDLIATGDYSWEVYLYFALIFLAYYTLFEWVTGRTLAKFLTNTKVANAGEGTRLGLLTSFLRSVSRLIPLEALSFLAKRPVGWHDALPGTVVINHEGLYEKKTPNRLSAKELSQFRNKHIGFVFQFHHLLPEFNALENVCIPGWLAGRKKKEVEDRARELLGMLGLSHRIENKPNQLSGGEQQRVAVARALINKPDIIFADEPTGNLDSANARELHQLFFDLRKQFNQTFLIVTHNEELAQLSDRVLHMKDGKIVAGGKNEPVTNV
jgi:lipoprotein-releasing system ATP-binding protein